MLTILIVLLYAVVINVTADDVLTQILQGGVTAGTYPGAVAIVGNENRILYQEAVGHFTYSKDSPPVLVL